MSTALHIATSTTNPTLGQSMARVLNDSFVVRLAVMNNAARALRAMGYRVVRQDFNLAQGKRPEVQINRDAAQSLSPLLDNSHSRYWRVGNDGTKRGYTVFKGVTVSWEER